MIFLEFTFHYLSLFSFCAVAYSDCRLETQLSSDISHFQKHLYFLSREKHVTFPISKFVANVSMSLLRMIDYLSSKKEFDHERCERQGGLLFPKEFIKPRVWPLTHFSENPRPKRKFPISKSEIVTLPRIRSRAFLRHDGRSKRGSTRDRTYTKKISRGKNQNKDDFGIMFPSLMTHKNHKQLLFGFRPGCEKVHKTVTDEDTSQKLYCSMNERFLPNRSWNKPWIKSHKHRIRSH